MATLDIKQVYDANPSTTVGNNDLLYVGKSPYGPTDDSAIKESDYFTQLAGLFVQTTGGVTSGNLSVYGANGESIKDCGVNVDVSKNMTGLTSVSVSQDPTTNLQVATKNYVDMVASGLNPAQSVQLATTANIPGTYNNGTSGVGATFTPTATGALTIDSVVANTLGARYLFKDLSTGAWNGIYTLTTLGSTGISPIYTRATDYNQPANINNTGIVPVLLGTVNTSTMWVQTSKITTVGTDSLTFSNFGITPLTLPVSIANGGTGVASVTTSPTASAWSGWDANKNESANNFLEGFTTTVTAAGTTPLTVASTYTQAFTGTTTQTVQLPVTSTLALGQSFYIINNSTGVVTITSSGGNTVLTLPSNSSGYVTCVLTSGTTAASWYADATGAGTDLFPNGTVLVTNSTQTVVNGTFYTADAAGIVTFTLPAASIGSYFGIAGINGWTLPIGTGITASIGNITLVGGATESWSSTGNSETVIFKWIGLNILQAISWTGLPVTAPGGSTPLPIIAGTNIAITRSGGNMSIATTGVPALASNNTFTKRQAITPVSISSSGGSTPTDGSASNYFTTSLTENTTLANPTNLVSGTWYTWVLTQHASAAKTVGLDTLFVLVGAAWSMTTTLSAKAVISGFYDGTSILYSATQA